MRARNSLAFALFAVLLSGAPAQAAEQLAGITRDDHVVLFRSDSPGNLQGSAAITGLAPTEKVIGIHVRPADRRLYALTSASRIYVLNPVTGAALQLNSPFAPALSGTRVGFSADPNQDRFVTASDQGQALRLDASGQVLSVTGVGSYVTGDPGASVAPRVSAIAFSNNAPGAQATTEYGIDTDRSTLVQFLPTNGQLATIGGLGIATKAPAGFDIAADGTAWAALRAEGNFPLLATVNLQTGAATLVGDGDVDAARIARRTSSRAASAIPVESIATLGPVADDTQAPRVVADVPTTGDATTLLRTGIPLGVSCDEACTIAVTSRAGAVSDAGTGAGEIQATAGSRAVTVRVAGDARALLRTHASITVRLRIAVTDAAGNATTVNRTIVAANPKVAAAEAKAKMDAAAKKAR